jgi:hypothetical protein
MPYTVRTLDERKDEVKHLMKQLNEYGVRPTYGPVKALYLKFKEYLTAEHSIDINIPFPEIEKKFKGKLAVSKAEDVIIRIVAI